MTTKIKFCGLTRPCDIEAVNRLKPDYAGFVFAPKSRRFISAEAVSELKKQLDPEIMAVGVFVNDTPETVAGLLEKNIIDIAQLHGNEDDAYIDRLRLLTDKPLIRAFRLETSTGSPAGSTGKTASEKSAGPDAQTVSAGSERNKILDSALTCPADHILLDSGAGSGMTFNWQLLTSFVRPYFLAGGLTPENAGEAVKMLRPFAVDVSSGIETDGFKDPAKMAAFIDAVRKGELS